MSSQTKKKKKTTSSRRINDAPGQSISPFKGQLTQYHYNLYIIFENEFFKTKPKFRNRSKIRDYPQKILCQSVLLIVNV